MELNAAGLAPLLERVSGLDLSDPGAACEILEAAFPRGSDFVRELGAAMRAAVARGELCQHGAAPVRYSRIFAASEDSSEMSADAVLMSAPGPLHEHPNGEISLCFAEDGDPCFDGRPPGWTVYAPGSRHVPTVTGGTMLIIYLLPGGAIRFLER